MVFWSHNITNRAIRRITAAIVSPLRRALTLPYDASTDCLLAECGLPPFGLLRSVTPLRFIQSFEQNKQPTPILKFYRAVKNQPHQSPRDRHFICNHASAYSNLIDDNLYAPTPTPLIAASVITLQTLNTSNTLFKSIRTSPLPATYLTTDDPHTAATRANLRSGHRLNAWRSGVLNLSNECIHCTDTESADHVLLYCHAYDTVRQQIEPKLKSIMNTTAPLRSSWILGDDESSPSLQKLCIEATKPLINHIANIRRI